MRVRVLFDTELNLSFVCVICYVWFWAMITLIMATTDTQIRYSTHMTDSIVCVAIACGAYLRRSGSTS